MIEQVEQVEKIKIEQVEKVEKVKVIGISGLCTNCNKEKTCDFIKDIDVFIKNKKCAEKILDTEVSVYSCEGYETEKSTCPEDGMCLSCKQEV